MKKLIELILELLEEHYCDVTSGYFIPVKEYKDLTNVEKFNFAMKSLKHEVSVFTLFYTFGFGDGDYCIHFSPVLNIFSESYVYDEHLKYTTYFNDKKEYEQIKNFLFENNFAYEINDKQFCFKVNERLLKMVFEIS